MSKDASRTLMVGNLAATILVIAIHYDSKKAIDVSMGYDWNYILQEVLINGVARSAVPFFAMLSGYFLINKIGDFDGYYRTLRNKARTLFVPYIVASTLIFVSITILKTAFKTGITAIEQLDLYKIAFNLIAHPASPQFWFLRDLMVLTVISPLLFNVRILISYVIGLPIALLWVLDVQPFPIVAGWYLINIETLFFFWLGGILFRYDGIVDRLIDCKNTTKIIFLISWGALIALRVYKDPSLDVWYVKNYTTESIILYKASIIFGVICIIQVSALMKNNRFLIYLSGLTFFVFLFHKVPLSYFTIFTGENAYSFFIDFPVATVFVFLLAHIASSRFNYAYTLITGGRSPNKALKRTE